MRKKRYHLIFTLVLGAAVGISTGRADPEPNPEPRLWPETTYRHLISTADRWGLSISDALFSALDSLDLAKLKFGPRNDSGVGLSVQRDVYDNADLLNTYTVIDRARVGIELSPLSGVNEILRQSLETTAFLMPSVRFILNAEGYVDFMHIHQVPSQKYQTLPSVGANFTDPIPDPDLRELNPYMPWYLFDPSMRARFGKILNPLRAPFRLPLNMKSYARMRAGDVMAYSLYGGVEVGAGAGYRVIPDPNFTHSGVDLQVTAFFEGEFQISVLKESERFARVKLTRLQKKTGQVQITAGVERERAFRGFFLFKGSNIEIDGIGAFDLKLIPFRWELSRMKGRQFDVGYRYDLSTEEGKEAYHRAVLGSFAFSDEIASREEENRPVTQIFERDAQLRERRRATSLELFFLLKRRGERNTGSIEATVKLPDGTHEVLKSTAERKTESVREQLSRKFTVALDRELYEQNDPGSLFLIAETFTEDSSTSGVEMRKKIFEIESFLGNPNLFPELPERVPHPRHASRTKAASFGRSSFYYGFHLGRSQIELFLEIPDARKVELANSILRESFTEPVLKRWRAAYEAHLSRDPKKLHTALAELFNDRRYGKSLMSLVRAALAGQSLDYFVDASNVAFGRVQERGQVRMPVEQLLTVTDQAIGFESYTRRLREDSEATLKDVRVEKRADGKLVLKFTLDQDATALYFRLNRTTSYRRYRTVADLVYANTSGRFPRGDNEIVLDLNSRDQLSRKLADPLHTNDYYTLTLAYSRDSRRFGPIGTTRFLAPEGYRPPLSGD